MNNEVEDLKQEISQFILAAVDHSAGKPRPAMATSSPVLQPRVPNEIQVAFVAPNVSNRYELTWNCFRICRPV